MQKWNSVTIMLAAVGLLAAPHLYGGTPRLVSYQGYLTNAGGSPLDTTISMTFRIMDAAVGGSQLWTETQASVTVTDGLFTVLLGSQTSLTDAIFSDTSRYLALKVGTDAEMAQRVRLATSPYAFRVETIDNATGGDVYGNITLHSYLQVGDGTDWGRITLLNGINPYSTAEILGRGNDNGGEITLDNSSYDATVMLEADDSQSGDVGGVLRLTDGLDTSVILDAGDFGAGAIMKMRNADNDITVILDAQDNLETSDLGARLTLLDGTSAAIILNAIDIASSGARIDMAVGTDTTVKLLANGSSEGGKLRLSMPDGTETIVLEASESGADGAQLTLDQAGGAVGVLIEAHEGTAAGGAIYLYNGQGIQTVEIDAQETDSGAAIRLDNGAGTTTITLDPDDSNGDGRVITSVLQITGGSDLSEQFDVRHMSPDDQPTPGMIVCIDLDNPGKLVVSGKAYDPTVAGIISGAGGVKPGMLMGQAGSISDGQHAVALTGRVYCWADASSGSIRPGDPLTSSETPGHAMKVTDYGRAQGAIIGKSMSTLEEGTGLVLVLVSLQ
ncbi:MAG TPA: hypothetical protein VN285_08825 [Candidatus Deferrimicrobium sp.]|nr:hypothetical protein [Candidatus Deferrimicrobium sp.]